MNESKKYGWAMNGLEQVFIGDNNNIIIFCMLPGVGGLEGEDMLEEQDDDEADTTDVKHALEQLSAADKTKYNYLIEIFSAKHAIRLLNN